MRSFLRGALPALLGSPRITTDDMDLRLCEYIEQLWEEGDSRRWATDAPSGFVHFVPQLRARLHGSRRLLKAWAKLELPERAAPLPASYAAALAGVALQGGDLRLCVCIMVAFHAFSRTAVTAQM